MSYLGEVRQNVRPLAAASLGVGTSLPLFAYTNSVFAPFLIQDFGWSRAQFALIGITMLVTLPFLPIIGRVTDKIGVKRVALTGTLLLLPLFIAYSQMQGNFVVFLVLFTLVLYAGVSLAIAVSEGQHVVWPSAGSVLESVLAGVLVLEMWALAGFALGTLARGPAL